MKDMCIKDICITLGLEQCPYCRNLPYQFVMNSCVISYYIKDMNDPNTTDKDIKEFYLKLLQTKKMYPNDNYKWDYYFFNAIILLFPEKKHIIEKLMILQ